MRIVFSILLFLTGCGLIIYSYIGSLVTLANDVERTAQAGDDASAFALVVDFILSGEIPQVTGFLYAGLLLIAFSVVNLIRRRSRNNHQDDYEVPNK